MILLLLARANASFFGASSSRRRVRVVIDAGHGGKDPGAIGVDGIKEKDLNLLAAEQLAKIFSKDKTFKVVLTRADDEFVPLSGRAALANQNQADIFISLHCNTAPDLRRAGFEIYSMSEQATDPEAQRLAEYENSVTAMEGKSSQETKAQLLLDEMGQTEFFNDGAKLAAFIKREADRHFAALDEGARKAGFYVLRGTHAPAVLVEMDYITSAQGQRRLLSKSFRKDLMRSVYQGVVDYIKTDGVGS